MKFCSNCKKDVGEENNFCPTCGQRLEEKEVKVKNTETKESVVEVSNAEVKQSNPLAITGFVLSLVSLLCCGFTSLLGLIFSIIGLLDSKKKNNSGKGLAIAGIIISAILLFLLIICYIVYVVIASGSVMNLLDASNLSGNYY